MNRVWQRKETKQAKTQNKIRNPFILKKKKKKLKIKEKTYYKQKKKKKE